MKLTLKKGTAALLAAAVLFLTACAGKTAEAPTDPELDDTLSGETLTAGASADRVFSLAVDYESPLNPITTTSSLNQMVDDLVYDRLFQVDENFNVTSRILEDWYYSKQEDQAGVWVLSVRPDIQMHDGSLLTGEDVAYSLSRVFTSGSTHYQQQMSRVYVSTYQGQVYLATDYDNGLLIQRMAVPIIKSYTNSILENVPVGSGPYMYSEDRQSLVKFDGYEFADTLPVDTIYLRQYDGPESLITEYESALVDLVVNDPTSIYNMGYGGKSEKRTIFTSNMHFVCFNSNSTFFRYEAYRNAMNYIIDRETVVSDVLDGAADPSALPIHPNCSLFDTAWNSQYAYDPARCVLELERGGCRDLDGDGQLEFALSGQKMEIGINFVVCADNAAKVQAARRIAQDMEAIGLTVNLKELSWNDYVKALQVDPEEEAEKDPEDQYPFIWDMYYGEIALTGDWNTLTLFTGDWFDDGTLNYGRWTLPEMEAAVRGFIGATDETRPDAEYAMLQSLFSNVPYLPVCFERREVISHVGVITGIRPNQYSVFDDFAHWKINLDGKETLP